MPESNITSLKQPLSNRTFELVSLQQFTAADKYKARREQEREKNADLLRFVLEELEGMQQRVGELRFAIAAMTTIVKDRLEHS